MKRKQSGFTLVEIAIVLVIIGLLLGGILKGQELINSARVRNLADTASGIQAAYFGFLDRYRRIPGDWNQAAATTAIGVAITNPSAATCTATTTCDNGRLDTVAGTGYAESNAMWEQLAAAGFIQGSYPGTNGAPTQANGFTPLNAFNAPILVGRTNEYLPAAGAVRLHLVVGRFVPVDVMRELDVKVDDTLPTSGNMRATAAVSTVFTGGPVGGWGGQDLTAGTGCLDAVVPPNWNVTADNQDCNAIILF